jgi:deoxyribonuclease V
MMIQAPHPWDVTPEEGIKIQSHLRHQVILEDQLIVLRTVAGVDVGFESDGKLTRAAVVVLSFPELIVQEKSIIRRSTTFPYIPGLLSFREAPAVIDAINGLTDLPDLLLCDGQGVAHPRHFGIACHLGLICNIPSIGVAKSRLVGKHALVGDTRGARQPILDGEEVVGFILRTRSGVKPVYVSPGHRVSMETSVDITLRCTLNYRLPEPIRQAHRLASAR